MQGISLLYAVKEEGLRLIKFYQFITAWCHSSLGKPSFQKSAVFLNIVQKAFDPPPLYLNICPILQGVFFKRVFAGGVF